MKANGSMIKFSEDALLPRKAFSILSLIALLSVMLSTTAAMALPVPTQRPSLKNGSSDAAQDAECQRVGPKGCVGLALEAMGGQTRLERIKSLGIEAIRHTSLTEQSYRQDP